MRPGLRTASDKPKPDPTLPPGNLDPVMTGWTPDRSYPSRLESEHIDLPYSGTRKRKKRHFFSETRSFVTTLSEYTAFTHGWMFLEVGSEFRVPSSDASSLPARCAGQGHGGQVMDTRKRNFRHFLKNRNSKIVSVPVYFFFPVFSGVPAKRVSAIFLPVS